jgi:hypothetical protein
LLRWFPFRRDAKGKLRRCPAGTVRFVVEDDPGGTRLTVVESRSPEITEAVGTAIDAGPGTKLRGDRLLAFSGR